jgi:hypothetical protein
MSEWDNENEDANKHILSVPVPTNSGPLPADQGQRTHISQTNKSPGYMSSEENAFYKFRIR